MKLPTITDILGLQKRDDVQKEKETEFDPRSLGEKRILYSWEALLRPTDKYNFSFNKNIVVIGVVIGLVLVIMQEFMLIFLIAGLIFMTHVLSKTNPENVKHEISNHGFSYAGTVYYWHQLKQFFFSDDSDTLLLVDTYEIFPGRLFVVINPKDREKIKDFMVNHVPYIEKEPKNFMDKAYDSVSSKFSFKPSETRK